MLLKFRLRSEREIYQRLKKKKFAEEIIRETIAFLKAQEFIDDKLFAKSWIESRLKKPLGLTKIRQELELKGVLKEIIDSQINEFKPNYTESDIVTKLAKQRFDRLKNVEPQKAKRRIYAELLRRGFSAEAAADAINQLI